MKKILILSVLCAILCSCNKNKQYKYIETIRQKAILGGFEEKNKDAEIITALNDSLAYIEAWNKFFISKKVSKDMLKEDMQFAQIPISFKVLDKDGNIVVAPNISQHLLDSIEAHIMGLDSGLHDAVTKSKNKKNNGLIDSSKIKKLSPLFVFKKDEFDPNGKTWIRPKSAPKYVDMNGIYCYFMKNNNGVSNFRLQIQYYADDWLFIRKYQFSIDGKAYEFIPMKVERDNGYGGKIWEWCDEAVTDNDVNFVKALAKAKSAKIKFIGDQYYNIKTIKTKELQSIKNTIDLYIAMGGKLE